jgi:arsenate reductase (thioredoxin)
MKKMSQKPMILFVCEHGAAKSIIAATYFNKMAQEMGLDLQALARGTNPDDELSQTTLTGLREDGLIPTVSTPQKISANEIENARRVISFCELPEEYRQKAVVEPWEDVPPVSENYKMARDAILSHLNHLVNNL